VVEVPHAKKQTGSYPLAYCVCRCHTNQWEYKNLIKRASAYFSVLFNVNAEILQEAAMKEKRKTLTEVLEELGFIAEWKAEGEAKGEVKGWGKALELMEKGYTVEQLKAMSPEKV
jgi:hypothetical protein